MSHQALIQRMQGLGNDESGVRAFMDLCAFRDPSTRSIFESGAGVASALAELDAAFQTQFGRSMSAAMQAPGSNMLPQTANVQLVDENEDSATYQAQGQAGQTQQLRCLRVNGRWYFDADALVPPGMPPAAMGQMMTQLAQVMRDMIGRIQGGEFPDAATAEQAVGQEMMKAMMGGAGGAGGMTPPPGSS
jgi:hypothetical protein